MARRSAPPRLPTGEEVVWSREFARVASTELLTVAATCFSGVESLPAVVFAGAADVGQH